MSLKDKIMAVADAAKDVAKKGKKAFEDAGGMDAVKSTASDIISISKDAAIKLNEDLKLKRKQADRHKRQMADLEAKIANEELENRHAPFVSQPSASEKLVKRKKLHEQGILSGKEYEKRREVI